MTLPGMDAPLYGQAEEQAPSGVASVPGIPLEAWTVVWEPLTKEQREAYERLHGYPPPGYRATGEVHWFQKHHESEAPCIHCGVSTDQFEIRETCIGTVPWAGATYFGHALCGIHVAVCRDCTRKEVIEKLERRQLNLEIYPELRARELTSLNELKAQLHGAAA